MKVSAKTFINSLGEHVIELDVHVEGELSANFRWSGKTALEAANKISTYPALWQTSQQDVPDLTPGTCEL